MDALLAHDRALVRFSLRLFFWTLVGVFFGTQVYLLDALRLDRPGAWTEALFRGLLFWYSWAALTPFVTWLTRTCLREDLNWPESLTLHLPACVLVSMLQLTMFVGVPWVFGRHGFLDAFQAAFARDFHWNVLVYWMAVSVSLAFDYHRRFRERERLALELEARLAQAQLHTLKMQLQPHFLFNTLNAISALMYSDPDGADSMITRLSDLLRLSLKKIGVEEVSLAEELQFLDHYLAIEKTRFADRLSVEVDVEPETLAARVPNLVLQPLVENAIRHGISQREGKGKLVIRARRVDGILKLSVEDDGPGLPPGTLREGIGLANTRARLEHMHGARQRLDLKSAPTGGVHVELEFPFRESPRG